MDTIRSSVAKLVQARCANPGSCMQLTLYRLRSQVAGFSIDSHLGLIWYPLLVTALAGATVRARCTVAQPCTVLLELSLELLWNTPRFVLGASSSERVLVA